MLCDLLSFTANIQSIDCKLDNFKKQHCLLMIKSIEHINTKLIMKTQSHTFSFKPYTFFILQQTIIRYKSIDYSYCFIYNAKLFDF